jgi:hypothetical protein
LKTSVRRGRGRMASDGICALFMLSTPIMMNWKRTVETSNRLNNTRQICPPVSTPVTKTYLLTRNISTEIYICIKCAYINKYLNTTVANRKYNNVNGRTSGAITEYKSPTVKKNSNTL